MKKITFFIGSSIREEIDGETELAEERRKIVSLLSDVNNIIFDKGYHIFPFVCEELSARMYKDGSQEEINRNIISSDICIFMFYTLAGKYTLAELKLAYETAQTKQKPKIKVFIKCDDEQTPKNDEIQQVLDLVEKSYKLPYTKFTVTDKLLYEVLEMTADILGYGFDIKESDSYITFCGEKISKELINIERCEF